MPSQTHIVDLKEMGDVNPLPNPFMWWLTARIFWFLQNVIGGIRVELVNFPKLNEPVIFAMNHCHYFDWTQNRLALYLQKGLKTSTFVKTRAFQNRMEGRLMKTVGNIPIASRGYLISADFSQVHNRKLEEEEYRLLRDHIDKGTPLPDNPVFQRLQSIKRDILGVPFDPDAMSYREAQKTCYARAMATTMGHAATVIRNKQCLHIYPEGLYSSRLSQGRIGAVQMAAALDIPIVPCGFSGMNEHFGNKKLLPSRRGKLSLRFGEPYRIQRAELQDFEAFKPDEEARLRDVLEDETHNLMNKINNLLDPSYTWGDDLSGDGLKGISRFFE